MKEDSNIERTPVMIEVAGPSDAQAMAKLKYENLSHRVSEGLLELSPNGRKMRQAGSDEAVKALTETLAGSNEDDYYLVAKNQKAILGMCRMTWQQLEKQFQLRQFYVRPNYMGRKIGSDIFSSAKERAQKSAHAPKGMFLYTGVDNKAAQEKYGHWGFKYASREESIFSKEDDKLVEYIKMVLDFQNVKDALMK